MLALGPMAAVAGATAMVVGACVAASPSAVVAAGFLVPVVLAGGVWRSSSSLTVSGCVLALSGIGVLWNDLVLGWPRVPLGATLFACAFVLAAVAIFQALREPAVATWVDSEVTTHGMARRHKRLTA
jgi:hypothetical protein